MTTQPDALRLAKRYEWFARTTGGLESAFVGKDMLMQAAAELRRLHEANQELLEALIDAERICSEVAAHLGLSYSDAEGIAKNARAAIAKAEGRA